MRVTADVINPTMTLATPEMADRHTETDESPTIK